LKGSPGNNFLGGPFGILRNGVKKPWNPWKGVFGGDPKKALFLNPAILPTLKGRAKGSSNESTGGVF